MHSLKKDECCYAGSKAVLFYEYCEVVKYCIIDQYPKLWFPPTIKKFHNTLEEKNIKLVKYLNEIDQDDLEIICYNKYYI